MKHKLKIFGVVVLIAPVIFFYQNCSGSFEANVASNNIITEIDNENMEKQPLDASPTKESHSAGEEVDVNNVSDWVDFADIESKGLKNAIYLDADHYVAEFLYQNPKVVYWDVDTNNSRIREIIPPKASQKAILLPKPLGFGKNDTQALANIINKNSGKEFIGQGEPYRVGQLNITADNIKIFNLQMNPAASTEYFVRVTGKNVKVFDSPIDAKNQGSVYSGWIIEADGFHLINSGFANLKSTAKKSGAGVVIKNTSADYHIAGNVMKSIINISGPEATHRANPFWIVGSTGSNGVRVPSGGGYIVNNSGHIAQSNGTLEDADFLTYQSHGSYKKVLKVFANRYKDSGKRFIKVQSPGIKILSNHAIWETLESAIPGGRVLRLHVMSIQSGFQNNFVARNNRIYNNNNANYTTIFNIEVGNPSQKWKDIFFENNYIEINSKPNPSQNYDKYFSVLRTHKTSDLSPSDSSMESQNVNIRNNHIMGTQPLRYNYWFGDGWDKTTGKVDTSGNIFKHKPTKGDERK